MRSRVAVLAAAGVLVGVGGLALAAPWRSHGSSGAGDAALALTRAGTSATPTNSPTEADAGGSGSTAPSQGPSSLPLTANGQGVATASAAKTPKATAPSTKPVGAGKVTGGGATTVGAQGSPPIALAWQSGKATFYGADGVHGACMPTAKSPTGYTVAVSPAEYANGLVCGSYVQVKGAKGTIVAKVDDLCPECERGHLDLSAQAFAAIDAPVKGIVPITYRGVRDPAVPGLVFKVKDGSSRYWLGLHIDNAGNPLAAVAVDGGNGVWHALQRQTYGFWTYPADLGAGGVYRVRVTDIYGHQVTASGVRLAVGVVQSTTLHLY